MPRITRYWIYWAITSGVMAAYCGLAAVARHDVAADLTLTPGTAITLSLVRVAPDILGLTLHENPGAEIRLRATRDGYAPSDFEAVPGYRGPPYRMTTRSSMRGGSFIWPPTETDALALDIGINTVRLEVSAVGPSIAGETVRVIIPGPLGFKSGAKAAGWLWPGLFWEAFASVQAIWAVSLAWYSRPRGGRDRSLAR